MSNFDDDKDYDLDYFSDRPAKAENIDENSNLGSEETGFDLNVFSSQSEANNEESSAEFNIEPETEDSGELDLSSFGKKRKDIKKEESAEKKAKTKRILKTTGKIFVSVMLIGVITGCLVIGAFAIYVFNFVDDNVYENLDELTLDFTTTIYVKNPENGEYSEYQRLHSEENRIWIDFDSTPKNLQNAFIAIEDKRFRDHQGVDWKRTVSAFANMFVHLYSSNQGGSTITQQLVKNLTGDDEQTPMRKIREIMRARYLESNYEKDTILECYLNTICLAGGMYGVEVASNYYFGKTASELTLAECASLASLAKNPEKYRPDKNPLNNKSRRETVLRLMYEQGHISYDEYLDAVNEEVTIVADSTALSTKDVNNYYVDALVEEVIDRLVDEYNFDESYASKNFYNGGYKIYCTLDTGVQDILEDEYSKTDKYFKSKSKKDGKSVQSAMTVVDYEGHIVALVGGAGGSVAKTENRSYNRATMAYRQPGSTMKPMAAYSLALQKNIIYYSKMVNDSPISNYRNGSPGPNNWYGYYSGNITAAYALEHSVNTIPCKLVKQMGVESTYFYVTENLGLTSLDESRDMNLSALGLGGTTTGITTTMSAAAFSVFGNLGHYYEPTTFTLMTDQHNNTILKQSDGKPAIDENTAAIMNHMLQNVVYGSGGTGGAAAAFSDSMKCYAKTGTSSDVNDCWFVGGTPYYVGSCWFGYDEPEAVSPSTLAKTMWTNVMKRVHANLEAKDFPISEFVTERYYCRSTGLLATDACSDVAVGYYKTNYSLPPACSHGGTLLSEIVHTKEDESPSSESDTSSTKSEVSSSATSSTKSEVSSSTTSSTESSVSSTSTQAGTNSSSESTSTIQE